ncbi:unnamed protein product [Urochloa decumbens]|uniref:MATH domain-containing protein n=1 Tax=Urochloa decumbens TaxID=240449 RepID=A0ABC9BGD4_9POAL
MLRPGSLHFTRGADMLRSGFLEFTLEHSPTKYLVVGDVVSSDEFSAGGYSWRIVCYPHGNERGNADYLSIFLKLVSESKDNIKAIFDVFLMGRDGKPSDSDACWCAPEDNPRWGFPQFVKRRDLAPIYAANGRVTMVCGVSSSCAVTPIPYRRRRRQILGSILADATMPVITVEEIDPAVFGVLLRFVYTDFFPEHEELGGSPTDMLQHLIAAADRYALDRLKIMCSQNLREKVSVDTVGSILACAEAYNCPELKQKCLDFIAVEKNLKEPVSRTWYRNSHHLLAAELRRRVVV